jgi:hypothetical protein
LVIGEILGLGAAITIVLAVILAFIFGYSLSLIPVVKAGTALTTAMGLVFAADTLSIAVMELVDNTVVAVIPGAMEAGIVNPIFWLSMSLALTVAFFAAYPVNKYLLDRGKGHALLHKYHNVEGHTHEH